MADPQSSVATETYKYVRQFPDPPYNRPLTPNGPRYVGPPSDYIETMESQLEKPFDIHFSYDFVDNTPMYPPGVYYFALQYDYRMTIGDLDEPKTHRGYEYISPNYNPMDLARSGPDRWDYDTRFFTSMVKATAVKPWGVVIIHPRGGTDRAYNDFNAAYVSVVFSVDSKRFYPFKQDWDGSPEVISDSLCESFVSDVQTGQVRPIDYVSSADLSNRPMLNLGSGPSKTESGVASMRSLKCTPPIFEGGSVGLQCFVGPTPRPDCPGVPKSAPFPPGNYKVAYTFVIKTNATELGGYDGEEVEKFDDSSDNCGGGEPSLLFTSPKRAVYAAESEKSVWSDVISGDSLPWSKITIVNWDELMSQPQWPRLRSYQTISLRVYAARADPVSNRSRVFLAADDVEIPSLDTRPTLSDCRLCEINGCKDLFCYVDNECPEGCQCVDGKCKTIPPPPPPPPIVPSPSITMDTPVQPQPLPTDDTIAPRVAKKSTLLLFIGGAAVVFLILFAILMLFLWWRRRSSSSAMKPTS